MKKIFVYGTLRKGMYNYDIYLRDQKSFERYAYVLGTLYTVKFKKYPALLLEGNRKILGEIHEISDDLMKKIDELEGYIAEGHEDNEYGKILCDIFDENDQKIESLPVYAYNVSNNHGRNTIGDVIECNDYVRYIIEKEYDEDDLFDDDDY